jgi:antitoxin component of MazEF toxin-antitoxin module
MIRRLTKQGNSTCLIIEKQIRELLDITTDTPLKISVENRRLIIEPLSEPERKARIRKALDETKREFDKDLKRLAK